MDATHKLKEVINELCNGYLNIISEALKFSQKVNN